MAEIPVVPGMNPPSEAPGVVLRVAGLRKRYGSRAVVDGIAFDVHCGECFGLLGPNGAGKTTTLRMLTGLCPADAGTLEIFGIPMAPEHRHLPERMGVVPQEDNLDAELTVRENLQVYGRYFGLPRTRVAARIETLLDFVQLTERAADPVRDLSGGMKRRLVIARSLIADPRLVILDEPTTGLDPQARYLIWQRLRLLKEQGVTLLLTTHYMEEAARLCDRLLILDQGRILDLGSPLELIARHASPQVLEIRSPAGPPPAAWFEDAQARCEVVGDALLCYAQPLDTLMRRAEARPELTLLRRPANLEDVFLRLTGRELRD
ncbi:MAG: ATP-binding cassette domain-containing protein [Magnetococcus sp. WYHC-3]